MEENNWQPILKNNLESGDSLQDISNYLKHIKLVGVSRDEVREYLVFLRTYSIESIDDRILETLDIVEGFCNEKYRVW